MGDAIGNSDGRVQSARQPRAFIIRNQGDAERAALIASLQALGRWRDAFPSAERGRFVSDLRLYFSIAPPGSSSSSSAPPRVGDHLISREPILAFEDSPSPIEEVD